jgi:two-component SAPR family response regulator
MEHTGMTNALLEKLKGRRVLVVEDQYLVAEEMRRMVVNLGGEVVGPVPRAGTALTILNRVAVDLAVLDINLGPEDVYPLAAELIRREVPLIFTTGCEPWVIPEEFRGVPRLDKPLTSRTFSEALQRVASLN